MHLENTSFAIFAYATKECASVSGYFLPLWYVFKKTLASAKKICYYTGKEGQSDFGKDR